MNPTTIEQSQPMKPRRFAELTGYTIGALDKQRNGQWAFTEICFKINNEWYYDYFEWKKWIRTQLEIQRSTGEHLTIAIKAPNMSIKSKAIKSSPQLPRL